MRSEQTYQPRRRAALGAVASAVAFGFWGCQSSKPVPPPATAPAASAPATASASVWTMDRTVLPIHEPKYPQITELDARDAKAPPVFEVQAPKGAPNVVVILLDDIGFGGMSHFGSPVATPTFDRMADEGLAYNQFHSTALCSPTRQALKTGRNHHSANQAKITEVATSFPGATGQLPGDVASIAKMLSYNGYSTGAFGKWHETAVWEISPSGPMDRWPNRQGFDHFYGFMGGETNQWAPAIYENQNPIEPPEDPEYHFMHDMTDQSIEWVRFQKALTPDRPFFMYFAPGAVHAPHHVPKKYIDMYKGKFDKGWDAMREEIHAKQLALGLIPKGTKLAKKPDDIKDWDKLSPKEKKLFARQAEVFAGFLHMTDIEVGRLIDTIERMGQLDNTLVFYIAGDNGTSAEGGMAGLYNEMTYFNGEPKGSDIDFMMKHYDNWGGPETYPHMSAGWAVAFDSPFTWTKQVASNYGGTRQGLAVRWPNGIQEKGGLRTQWHHVIDVVPTILEAAQLPEPKVVDGVPQRPIEGVSMLYSFNDASAKDRHTTQYFEMFGNRGVYHNGWFAGTVHLSPWGNVENKLVDDTWALYHVAEDFSMSTDRASDQPDKLAELQKVFKAEAMKYKVLPIDDRRQELLNPKFAGRPDLMFGRKSLTLSQGMGGLPENNFINIKNSSFHIVANLDAQGPKTEGVIVSQGGRFGGWAFYVRKGKPAFVYNYLGLETFEIESKRAIPPGAIRVKAEFAYDGGGPGKGGHVKLFIDDKEVGAGRVEQTQAGTFSADETANVGVDTETAVSDRYATRHGRFTGKITDVTITVL